MPTYQYACNTCGEDLEVVQKFTDDALTECPACGGKLRKVYSPVGVVFKGSGFYRNDSRDAKKSTAASVSGAAGNGSSNGKAKESSGGDSSSNGSSSSDKSTASSSSSSSSSPSSSKASETAA